MSGRKPQFDFSPRERLIKCASRVLSAYEGSSAACITDTVKYVNNGLYLEAIRKAESSILHVEVLFGAIDDLEWHFARQGVKGMVCCPASGDHFLIDSYRDVTRQRISYALQKYGRAIRTTLEHSGLRCTAAEYDARAAEVG